MIRPKTGRERTQAWSTKEPSPELWIKMIDTRFSSMINSKVVNLIPVTLLMLQLYNEVRFYLRAVYGQKKSERDHGHCLLGHLRHRMDLRYFPLYLANHR